MLGRLKPTYCVRKRSITVFIILFIALSVIVTGTYAWFSLVQRVTNEFVYEPYDIRLVKHDKQDPDLTLMGAVFDLYEQNGKYLSTYITNENGEILLYNLEDGKKYYFIETKAPRGYKLGEGEISFTVGVNEIQDIFVENEPELSLFRISKTIADTYFPEPNTDPQPYIGPFNEPFEFTVNIGEDPFKDYHYVVRDSSGTVVSLPNASIKSGGTITLMHGETAYFEDVSANTRYEVIEEDLFTIDFYDNPHADDPDDPFGCNEVDQHTGTILGVGNGWFSSGSYTHGRVAPEGTKVSYVNHKAENTPITISSLVVMERIVANPVDIDRNMEFEVVITLLDDAPEQQYWYEVIEVPEEVIDDHFARHDETEYYYSANDPVPHYGTGGTGAAWYTPADESRTSALQSAMMRMLSLLGLANPLLSTANPLRIAHEPSEYERYDRKDNAASTGGLQLWTGNSIKVPLRHSSAVIVYGIPVGSRYEVVEAKDYLKSDGYYLESAIHTVGDVWPDLDAVPAVYNVPDSMTARTRTGFDPDLWRTRIDLLHSFAVDDWRKYTVTKSWDHTGNPNLRPEPQYVTVYMQDPNGKRYSTDLRPLNGVWQGNIYVPIHDENDKEIDYTVHEMLVPDYVPEFVFDPDNPNIQLTNTYDEDPEDLGVLTVRKAIAGAGADPKKEFRFTVTINGVVQPPLYLRGGEKYIYDNNGRKYPAGTAYSVVEDRYPDYVTTKTGDFGTITRQGAVASFVNTKDNLEKSTLTVKKTVRGETDPHKRFDFTVVIGKVTYKITLADAESYVFTDIPVGTHYSISEDYQAGYIVTAGGTDGTIVKNGNTAAFVNTKGEVSGVGSLTVAKEIAGQYIDATKKFRFTVVIRNFEYEIFLKHGESYTFTDIAAGTPYTVTEDDYSYQDYITVSRGATGTITNSGVTAAFINAYSSNVPPKPDDDAVQISGKKTWIHGTNKEIPQSITVYALNGNQIVAQKNVTAAENWSYAFNLPRFDATGREIAYSINEDTIKNYRKTVNGYDLENTYGPTAGPQTGDYSAMWIWFIVLFAGIVGLRVAVFYRRRRKK